MAVADLSYRTKYRSEVVSRFGDRFRVDFQRSGYAGEARAVDDIVSLRTQFGNRDLTNNLLGIIPSRLSLDIYVQSGNAANAALISEIVDSTVGDFQVVVSHYDEVRSRWLSMWTGFLLPDEVDESLSERRKLLTFKASDGSVQLRDEVFNGDLTGRQKISKVLFAGIRKVREIDFYLLNMNARYHASTPITREILSSLYIDCSVLEGRSWYDIIDTEILKRFGLCMSMERGSVIVFDVCAKGMLEHNTSRINSDGDRYEEPGDPEDGIPVGALRTSQYEVRSDGVSRRFRLSTSVISTWEHLYDSRNVELGSNQVENGDFEDDPDGLGWSLIGNTPQNTVVAVADRDGDKVLSLDGAATSLDTVYAGQEVERPFGEAYFGARFRAQARWNFIGQGAAPVVANARAVYAIKFIRDSGDDDLWWNADMREWQTAVYRNSQQISTSPVASSRWTQIVATPSDTKEAGKYEIRLYGGTGPSGATALAIFWEWNDVELEIVGASAGQHLVRGVRATAGSDQPSLLRQVPSERGNFIYGTGTQQEKYVRQITTDEAGTTVAGGFKTGDYADGEESTGHTLDRWLSGFMLQVYRPITKRFEAPLSVTDTHPWSPSLSFEYEGEGHLITQMTVNILYRSVHVTAQRIAPEDVPNVRYQTILGEPAGASVSGGARRVSAVVEDVPFMPGEGLVMNDDGTVSVRLDGGKDSKTATAVNSGLALGAGGLAHAGGNIVAGGQPVGTNQLLTRITLDRFGHARVVNTTNLSGTGFMHRDSSGNFSLQGGVLPPSPTSVGQYFGSVADGPGISTGWVTFPASGLPSRPGGLNVGQFYYLRIGSTGPSQWANLEQRLVPAASATRLGIPYTGNTASWSLLSRPSSGQGILSWNSLQNAPAWASRGLTRISTHERGGGVYSQDIGSATELRFQAWPTGTSNINRLRTRLSSGRILVEINADSGGVTLDGASDSATATATASGLTLSSSGLKHAGGNLTAGNYPAGTNQLQLRLNLDRFGHVRSNNVTTFSTQGFVYRTSTGFEIRAGTTGSSLPTTSTAGQILVSTTTGQEWRPLGIGLGYTTRSAPFKPELEISLPYRLPQATTSNRGIAYTGASGQWSLLGRPTSSGTWYLSWTGGANTPAWRASTSGGTTTSPSQYSWYIRKQSGTSTANVANNNVVHFTAGGGLTIDTTVNRTIAYRGSGSDRRLKGNLKAVSPIECLFGIRKITPYTFLWLKEEGFPIGSRSCGVIAQEVENIFPEIVSKVSDGILYVHYPALCTRLLGAVKGLDSLLKVQTSRLDLIESRISILEAA